MVQSWVRGCRRAALEPNRQPDTVDVSLKVFVLHHQVLIVIVSHTKAISSDRRITEKGMKSSCKVKSERGGRRGWTRGRALYTVGPVAARYSDHNTSPWARHRHNNNRQRKTSYFSEESLHNVVRHFSQPEPVSAKNTLSGCGGRSLDKIIQGLSSHDDIRVLPNNFYHPALSCILHHKLDKKWQTSCSFGP